MKRFIESQDRRQATLLPDSMEDYVTDDNPVRVIDVFIAELDLAAMGFAGVAPEATGRARSILQNVICRSKATRYCISNSICISRICCNRFR